MLLTQLLASLTVVSAVYLPYRWAPRYNMLSGEMALLGGFRFFDSKDGSYGEHQLIEYRPVQDFGACYNIPKGAHSVRLYGFGGALRFYGAENCDPNYHMMGSYRQPGSILMDINPKIRSFQFRAICHRRKDETTLLWCDPDQAMDDTQPAVEEGQDRTWRALENGTNSLVWTEITSYDGTQDHAVLP